MSALFTKLVRDVWRTKEQGGAIALVMACGIATFVMSLSMIDSLQGALDAYYERGRFAHVFAQARRAPITLERRLAEIPGVGRVECRVTESAVLEIPGMVEPATARLVSLPDDPAGGLNAVHLRAGRFPQGRDHREALISERFAEAHGLASGDSVTAVLNGRRERLRVVGIALSPEFIYLIPPGGLLPEHDRFGVFWMGREEMEAAFDMEGAFNDVSLRLMPGAREQDVVDRADALLERFGCTGAYTRADHPSHQFLENELSELRNMAIIAPGIFLGVAAFLLHLVLARIIATQREQIAALRALGYTSVEIGRHYLAFALLISSLGGLLGVAFGAWLGRGLTAMYGDFFDFPVFHYELNARVVGMGLLTGPLAGTLGTLGALWGAMRLHPAEAMRPPSPVSHHATILDRLGVLALLPLPLRMVTRHLQRRPVKTSMSALGVAMATSILVVGGYTEDATDYLLDFQFNRVQQRDVDLAMTQETDDRSVDGVRALPGVLAAEPYRSVAVRLRHGHVSRRTGVLGLARRDGMHQLLSMYGRAIDLPEHGIVLSTILAERLGLRPGDLVTVEALEGRRPVFRTPVTALIDDFSGLAAYMRLTELNRMMREPGTVSGAYVRLDGARLEEFYGEVRETPRVAGVSVKSSTERSFRDTIEQNLGLMRSFLIAFSAVIAFGVVYNTARVSLSERQRDLASLRILGFTKREIGMMQLGELAIVTALGVPVGLAMGHGLSWMASEASQTELFRMPFLIRSATFGLAALVVMAASVVSGVVIVRRVQRLDLMSVLKARE